MYVEFSQLKLNLLILLIFPIFIKLERYTKKAYLENDNKIFKTFRYFLCYILAGIFLILSKIKNKKISSLEIETKNDDNIDNVNKEEENESETNLIKPNNEKKTKIKNILFLALLCAIAMFCFLYRCIFDQTDYKYSKPSVGIFFNIIFLILFSVLIIKLNLYRHHYLSICFITISIIVIFIISLKYMKKLLNSLMFYFFYALFFCLYDVLKKKYMNSFNKYPYDMMFVIGLINSILLLIYEVITYFSYPDISGIIIGFQKNINSVGNIFLFFLDILLEFICYLGLWVTIYYFTPSHCFISENISEYINYITNAIETDDDFYSLNNRIIYSICNIINFFGFLIFTEVIILNFCKLDYNTIKRIRQRESKDYIELNENYRILNEDRIITEEE